MLTSPSTVSVNGSQVWWGKVGNGTTMLFSSLDWTSVPGRMSHVTPWVRQLTISRTTTAFCETWELSSTVLSCLALATSHNPLLLLVMLCILGMSKGEEVILRVWTFEQGYILLGVFLTLS